MQRTKTKATKKKVKKGEPRYPAGKYPIYDFAYEQAVKNSPVLNPSARHLNNGHWQRPETALYMLQGDPSHDHYFKLGDDNWKPSLILSAKQDLKDAQDRFDNWATEQVRTGKSLEKPTKWPEPFMELRLKREAILDARLKEVASIKKQQAEEKAKKEQERISNILPNGPLGNKKDDSIDGQRISYTFEGTPYIDEPNSKYHGMSLYHYKQMAKDWTKENGLTTNQILEERNRLYEKARADAHKKGLEPPTTRKSFHQFRKEKFAEITEDDFPDWPDDAKPINELETNMG